MTNKELIERMRAEVVRQRGEYSNPYGFQECEGSDTCWKLCRNLLTFLSELEEEIDEHGTGQ